jgi:D-serine deaminase-like pyridoxal phosphate-dependent protein
VEDWATVPGTTDLPTPCLVLDAPAFHRNLATMAAFCRDAGVSLRPHAKTHKSSWIARQQIECGATGIAVATLAEGAGLVAAGIGSILLTTPAAGAAKLSQLHGLLAGGGDLTVVAESVESVAELADLARRFSKPVDVMVDVDAGNGRTGALTPGAAADVASAIAARPELRLAGLQAYAGHVQHIGSLADRGTSQQAVRDRTSAALAAIRARGIAVPIVTGGGTGSFFNDARLGPFTEVQPGSYTVMDQEYAILETVPGEPVFEPAIYVVATVVADAGRRWVTVDAGSKALAESYTSPLPVAATGAHSYRPMGDELGAIETTAGSRPARGDRILIRPAHCDPTMNLYRSFFLIDVGERSAREIPIDLR